MRAAIAASLLLITTLSAGCDDSGEEPAAAPSGAVSESGSAGTDGTDGATGSGDGEAAGLPVFCDLITADAR